MSEVISIGPFLIKVSWLMIALSVFIGYWMMILVLKQTKIPHRQIADLFMMSVVTIVLIWKFGPMIFNPFSLFNQPINILYGYGTDTHILFGVFVAILLVIIQTKKKKLSLKMTLDAFTFALLSSGLVYHLFVKQYGFPTELWWGVSAQQPGFKYHPINIYFVIINLLLFAYLWRFKRNKIGSGTIFKLFLIFYGGSGLLISFFTPQLIEVIGLSVTQIIYIAMITLGIVSKKPTEYEV